MGKTEGGALVVLHDVGQRQNSKPDADLRVNIIQHIQGETDAFFHLAFEYARHPFVEKP